MSNDDIARSILDGNSYVVLATADGDGRPWGNPVWFAHEDYRELYWVSSPDSVHSINIAVRPQLAMVVFDSTAAPNAGQAVYMTAEAGQVDDPVVGIEVISRRGVEQGMEAWDVSRVTGDARLRASLSASLNQPRLKAPARFSPEERRTPSSRSRPPRRRVA